MTVTHDDLALLMGEVKGRLESIDHRLINVEGDLGRLKDVASVGRGALWAAFKVGAILMAVGAAIAWASKQFAWLS